MDTGTLFGRGLTAVACEPTIASAVPMFLAHTAPERTYFSDVGSLPMSSAHGAHKHGFQFEMAATAMKLTDLSMKTTGEPCVRTDVSAADIPSVVVSIREHAFSPCAVRLCGEQYQELATPERFETYSIIPAPNVELFFDQNPSNIQAVLPAGFAAHPRNLRSPLVL